MTEPTRDRQLEDFLHRAKADQKSSTLRERTERLLHESALRSALAPLRSDGFRVQESLVPVTPTPAGDYSALPDFLVQREDVLLHLYLVLGQPEEWVGRELVRRVFDMLNSHAVVNAAVFVWPVETYSAVVLDAFLLRKYLEGATDPIQIQGPLKPVGEAIKGFYEEQFVTWNIPEGLLSQVRISEDIDLEGTIRRLLNVRVQQERTRKYEIPAKVGAQQELLGVSLEPIVESLLEILRRGELSDEAADRLADLIEWIVSRHD